MINIQSKYQEIIEKLRNNQRALIKLTKEDVDHIIQEWTNLFTSKISREELEKKLEQILCLLDNSQTTDLKFHHYLLKTFDEIINRNLNPKIFIFLLAAIQKQIIIHAQKTGDRLPFELFEKMIVLLKSKDPEILEWTLRTIDSMGVEGIRLQKEILKLRPSLLKIFNAHQRNSFEIIEHLKQSWIKIRK